MRKLALLVLISFAALAVGAAAHPPRANAEDVLARALDASTSAAVELGDYTWLEGCGIGIKLPPAPPGDAYPRLLAGKRLDSSRSDALWEAGPDGFTALRKKLETAGIRFGGSEAWSFRPRRYPDEIPAHRSNVTVDGGRQGVVTDWEAAGRRFALVVTDVAFSQASRRTEDLLREMIELPDVEPDGLAPLFFQGRYASVLNGWNRDGERLRLDADHGLISLRVFQVALSDYDNVGRLQFELEDKLKAAGFGRSAGLKPNIAGNEGFIGEYSRRDGYVQRVAYARLEGGYMVALMQAPERQRNQLMHEMDGFARHLQITGTGADTGSPPLMFNAVRNVRCLAWQDGRKVLWGALFDDSRRQQVMWRQQGIVWNIQMTQGGQTVRERQGTVNSSRALNPLVDADSRALTLPEKLRGEVELTLNVGGTRQTKRITIR